MIVSPQNQICTVGTIDANGISEPEDGQYKRRDPVPY
jgi:hypothetical protein